MWRDSLLFQPFNPDPSASSAAVLVLAPESVPMLLFYTSVWTVTRQLKDTTYMIGPGGQNSH